MLSISINKKLDYSTPIMFVFNSAQTESKNKNTTENKKKIVPIHQKPKSTISSPIKTTENKTVNTQKTMPKQKPTTVAAAPAKKVDNPKSTLNNSIAVADVKKVEKIEPVKEIAKVEPPEEKIVPPIAQALENAQVSHNYREVEALRKQAQLQKEIVQKWKPPIGVSPDCMCEVSFFVNAAGAVENIKMVKTSGVMMFDISTRQALFATKMPHWTYGKSLTISFKQ